MCMDCWKHYGSPRMKNKKIEAATIAIRNLYKDHIMGGDLHIVVDDWNLEDHHLKWCFKNKTAVWDDLHDKCYNALDILTVPQRASALKDEW